MREEINQDLSRLFDIIKDNKENLTQRRIRVINIGMDFNGFQKQINKLKLKQITKGYCI
jgi:hypothetical protein